MCQSPPNSSEEPLLPLRKREWLSDPPPRKGTSLVMGRAGGCTQACLDPAPSFLAFLTETSLGFQTTAIVFLSASLLSRI